MLEIKPIFHALCRSKVGAILLLIQIAITTAIVSNAAFIIQDRIAFLNQQTGYPEHDLFKFNVMTFGKDIDLSQQFELDEAMLRALPGIVNAAQSSSIPLSGSGSAASFNLKPAPQESRSVRTAYIFIDEHGLDTYGIKLLAGRNFTADEVLICNTATDQVAQVTVVTQALADELFPEQDALGKTTYFGDIPLKIIGITAPMKSPWLKDSHPNNVALIPYIQGKNYTQFAVRTKPGQRAKVMKEIENLMLKSYSKRVINNIVGLDDLKDQYVAADKLMMRMLVVLIAILVLVTALGIFGLTLFNISKRTKEIGTRRALGARKSAIVNYFLVENALICSAGLILGAIVALLLGQLLMQHFSVATLPLRYIAVTALLVFVMSLLAVLAPAKRAANISPSIATRTI